MNKNCNSPFYSTASIYKCNNTYRALKFYRHDARFFHRIFLFARKSTVIVLPDFAKALQ